MQNLKKTLIEILKNESTYFSEDRLLKNKLTEDAFKLEPRLIKYILSNHRLKKHFFLDIDGVLVFDKDKFIQFVNDKQFLPDSYTSFKNTIGLLDENGDYFKEKKQVVLAWPYKDCVLEGGQDTEDQKRTEIFYNEILAPDEIDRLFDPKVLTSFNRYDKDGEHSNPKISQDDNLIIKGNNLLALHSLKKLYRGKVKLICIDLPFNTESQDDSFKYNDKFKHSTWLTFIKNRLEVCKEFLLKDGFICLHIDDNEMAYLKTLCDEVFDRNNFINAVCIRDSHPSGLKLSSKEKTIVKTKSYVLVYSNTNHRKIYPLYQLRTGGWDKHFNSFVEIDSEDKTKRRSIDFLKKNKIVKDDFKLDENALADPDFRKFAFENRNKIFQSTKEIPNQAKELSLRNPNKVIEYNSSNGEREFAFNGRRLSPLTKSIWDIGFDGYYKEDFAKLLCDFWDDIDFNNTQNEGGVDLPKGKKPEHLLARLLSCLFR